MRVITQLTNKKNRKRTNIKLPFISGVVFALMLVVTSSTCAQQSAGVLLQSGLYKENVNGDLEAAIAIYERVLKEFPKERPIAAKALLHIGLCYEKLGKQEAQKAYQRLIKEFADQHNVADQARERLAGMERDNGNLEVTIRKIWGVHGTPKEMQEAHDENSALYWLTWSGDSRPSPNSRYIAYTNWGPPSIGVYDLSTGKSRDITDEGTWDRPPTGDEFGYHPIWSPDGRYVAYTWCVEHTTADKVRDHYELRIVGLDGAEPCRVIYRTDNKAEEVKPYDWSPDGKTVLATIEHGKTRSARRIVLISVEDGTKRILKSFGQDLRRLRIDEDNLMFFSPDGRYIAYDLYQSSDYPHRDIFLFKTDGSGESIPLVTHAADDQLLGWAPDGKRLLFTTNRTGVKTMAFIEVHEGTSQGSPQMVRRLEMGFKPMGLAQNGTYCYSLSTNATDVYRATLDLETGKVVVPPALVNAPMEGPASTPCWSSDGQYLAYLSSSDSDSMESLSWWAFDTITVRSAKGHKVREVELPAQIRMISYRTLNWSPDGSSFLFYGVPHKPFKGIQPGGIYRMDAQTGEVSLVMHGDAKEVCTMPQWSLDGKSVFYGRTVVRRGKKGLNSGRILERNLETGKEREIAKDVNMVNKPFVWSGYSVSPDDRKVAFVTIEVHENETQSVSSLLKVKPVAGGEATELFRMEGLITIQGWTPDGRQILFQDSDLAQNKKDLWRIPATGGQPRKIELTMKEILHLRVHPDGRQVAFDVAEGKKLELWAMENFLPESTTNK
jgi:Tol biopolymer transport system component